MSDTPNLPVVAYIEHHKAGDNLLWEAQKSSPSVSALVLLSDAQHSLDALRAERDEAVARTLSHCQSEIDKVRAERDALRADAERDAQSPADAQEVKRLADSLAHYRSVRSEGDAMVELTRSKLHAAIDALAAYSAQTRPTQEEQQYERQEVRAQQSERPSLQDDESSID